MKLSEYLAKHKIEQQDFAKSIRVKAATVSRYVTGERIPRREIERRIAKVTGGAVTISDFYA
jgi:transcriptional regulator with XRE-family HTH domain